MIQGKINKKIVLFERLLDSKASVKIWEPIDQVHWDVNKINSVCNVLW